MAGGDGVTTYESEERQTAHNILPPRHIRVCLCLSVFLCGDSAQTDAVTDVGNTAETELPRYPHRY